MYYLLIIHNDIEPELRPFDTEEARDAAARQFREEEGSEHGLFPMEAEGVVSIDTYSNAFFRE